MSDDKLKDVPKHLRTLPTSEGVQYVDVSTGKKGVVYTDESSGKKSYVETGETTVKLKNKPKTVVKKKTYKTYTPSEMAGLAGNIYKDIGETKFEQQKQIETSKQIESSISSNEKYKVDMGGGKNVVMPGILLKPIVSTQRLSMEKNLKDIEQAETRSLKSHQFYIRGTYSWHPDTKVKETDKGYNVVFPYAGAEHYNYYKKKLDKGGFSLGLATALTGSDPLGLTSAYYTATGNRQKFIDTKIKALHDTKSKKFHEFYFSSPMGVIGTSYAAATGIGAGLGALSAVSATGGKIASVGIGSYFTYKTGEKLLPQVTRAQKSGDYGQLVGSGTNIGLAIGSGIPGYKSGYHLGYGRTESWLYARSTYKPGSSEFIRFKSTIKTARSLQFVKSSKQSPLDFTKDIMRLDSKTAKNVMSYLKSHPKSVIGGSSSQFAQTYKSIWFKHRDIKPRDIDLLVKDVGYAKKFIGGRSHQVDVHGFEMGGKSGRYMRFGFTTQRPIKIGDYSYMRLGEQMSRKGISSIMTETKYRWFKDIPDFQMTSHQLIVSGKQSWNPFTRFRVWSASKSYTIMTQPSIYTKKPSFFSNISTRFAKYVYKPSKVSSGYYSGYGYKPSYLPIAGVSSYVPMSYKSNKQYIKTFIPKYKPVSIKKIGISKTYYKSTKINIPKTTVVKTPSYKSSTTIYPKTTVVKTPSYKPSTKTYPDVVKTPNIIGKKIMFVDIELKPKKTTSTLDLIGKRYRFREFKIPSLKKLSGGLL